MTKLASAGTDNETLVWHESLRGDSQLPSDRLINTGPLLKQSVVLTGILLYSEYRLAFPTFSVSERDNILLYRKSVWLTLLEFTNITMSAIHLECLTL